MRLNNQLSFVLGTILLNIVLISTANAQQCRSNVKVSGWDQYSDYYTGCHPWMKATMEFDVGDNNGMGEFMAFVNNSGYEKIFNISYYQEEDHVVDIEYRYCTTLTEHQASIELLVGIPPGEETEWWGFANPVLSVSYYASQPY